MEVTLTFVSLSFLVIAWYVRYRFVKQSWIQNDEKMTMFFQTIWTIAVGLALITSASPDLKKSAGESPAFTETSILLMLSAVCFIVLLFKYLWVAMQNIEETPYNEDIPPYDPNDIFFQ